jgi:hypothetical protein
MYVCVKLIVTRILLIVLASGKYTLIECDVPAAELSGIGRLIGPEVKVLD